MTVPLLWDEAVGRLRSRVTEKNYDMWLRPIELLSFDGVVLRLRAPNSYARFWFESNFLGALLKEIRDLGHDVRVEFDADGPDERPPKPPPQQATGTVPPPLPQPPPPAPPVDQDAIAAPEAASLNPRYTFDTFVAGPSNQLAFAASQAAASSYPPKYNPVFLCGGVGLGKTHLLHSIGHQQLANRPSARIVYLSSERFMNEFVQAIRTGRMHEFRRNYREGIDVLLIDDVQFLAGKESTQD
ncbi:MAG TPA: DnaA/Hda family protein, partial [Kofleriaceae bacterium]|nr:DnaA/Hda family protein [Kofleriaceae bacterium]